MAGFVQPAVALLVAAVVVAQPAAALASGFQAAVAPAGSASDSVTVVLLAGSKFDFAAAALQRLAAQVESASGFAVVVLFASDSEVAAPASGS